MPGAIEIDKAKAIAFWKKGLEQGDSHIQVELGKCYYEGIPGILKQDPVKGFSLVKKAAKKGMRFGEEKLKEYLKVDLLDEGFVS